MNEQNIRNGFKTLTEELIARKLTVTTMESATSGLIASLITDTEGSSSVLKGAFVTYSNDAKIMQGVNPEVIEKYSVYSIQTAEEMAGACQKTYNADIGIGVTGTFGNIDPANAENSVPGHVFYAIKIKDKFYSYSIQLEKESCRFAYKMAVAGLVLSSLFDLLGIGK